MKKKSFLTTILVLAGVILTESALAVAVDPPIGTPIYRRCEFNTFTTIEQCTLFKVPAGRIFVLESVTAQIFTSGTPYRLKLSDPNGLLAASNAGIPFTPQYTFSSSSGNGYTVNQLVKLYYGAGKTIQAYLTLSLSEGYSNEVTISGFLVNK